MICENCGKSNAYGEKVCRYCKAKMPETSKNSGFGDILSYKNSEVNIGTIQSQTVSGTEKGLSEIEMKKLMYKLDKIEKNTKQNNLFTLIAICLCVVLMIMILCFGIAGNSSDNDESQIKTEQVNDVNSGSDDNDVQNPVDTGNENTDENGETDESEKKVDNVKFKIEFRDGKKSENVLSVVLGDVDIQVEDGEYLDDDGKLKSEYEKLNEKKVAYDEVKLNKSEDLLVVTIDGKDYEFTPEYSEMSTEKGKLKELIDDKIFKIKK